ncbi:MAG: molybdopterin cofactor-binding domain-containing protein [Leptolinea sp.]
MLIRFELNNEKTELEVMPGDTLLDALRRAGCWSVKHGCETGECGACSVLIDGKLTPTCVTLAPQADGQTILTTEGLSEDRDIHPIQRAFIDTGAIQCGYCTPGMLLATKALLDNEKYPDLVKAREAIGSVLCRCTGYVKPVEAVMRAAALMRGEEIPSLTERPIPFEEVFPFFSDPTPPSAPESPDASSNQTITRPHITISPTIFSSSKTSVVGAPEQKKDAIKLVKGRPVFADDINLPGMLHAALLTSPHAHARIRHIDASKARELTGVRCVLTYQDVPRVMYATGGQTYPNPKPWDQVCLDNKVRHIGDRVAVVAADTLAIARKALELIDVDYELLPAVFEVEEALKDGAPVIHDEPDAVDIKDAQHNLVTTLHAAIGDVDKGLAEADLTFERSYYVPQVQQASIEPHITITYWDEDDRLVVRTSTQVPYHVRRMLSPLIGLPVSRIRVIKPRVGGGFGGKQEMLIEDLAAHLTVKTGKPVRFEYTREQEFTSARSRHPAKLTFRAGVSRGGMLKALDLSVIEDSGAYGVQAMTVCSVIGMRGLSTYRCENARFHAEIVYTNKPVPGAFRGYGGPQGLFALESLMDEIAAALKLDPLDFRMQNVVRLGDPIPIMTALGEAGPVPQSVKTSSLPECVEKAATAIEWKNHSDPNWKIDPTRPNIRRGLGMAIVMHGTAIPGLDMGSAIIKMNDDGSFNLMIGATDIGTGSDTILGQIAAETMGVPLSKVQVLSSDTDITPFDVGAYASSTTFISGNAVHKAAEQVRERIFERAALMLNTTTQGMLAKDDHVYAIDGRNLSMAEIALHSLHRQDQQQIMGTASHISFISPPSFGAQYAEVEVDIETGEVTVKKLTLAVDCGTVINPITAIGQMDGGQTQALGYAVSEEMCYDDKGSIQTRRFGDYHIFQADEMPEIISILVPTYEESGPYGAKGLGEIPIDGVGPAVANAVYHATGVRVNSLPIFPEKLWREINKK